MQWERAFPFIKELRGERAVSALVTARQIIEKSETKGNVRLSSSLKKEVGTGLRFNHHRKEKSCVCTHIFTSGQTGWTRKKDDDRAAIMVSAMWP